MQTQLITPPAQAQASIGENIFNAVFNRTSQFRVELDFDAAISFIRKIGTWNDFDYPHVLDALESIDRLIPRRYYGEGNPNNGERSYSISIGKEFSPVIYIQRHEFSWLPSPLSDATIQSIRATMGLVGQADESDVHIRPFTADRGRLIEFRFWWD